VWIAAHAEHFLKDRRDEAEAAAQARRRRRALREPIPNDHIPADWAWESWG
jgi:hypothetical protein